MTPGEAGVVVAAIAAAWPSDWAFADALTRNLYQERVRTMPRKAAAEAAVRSLIDSEDRLPSIAKLRDAYSRYHDRFSPPALEEPALTPDDVARNTRRIRAMTAHVRKIDGHEGEVDSCPHADCDYLRTLSVPGAGQD